MIRETWKQFAAAFCIGSAFLPLLAKGCDSLVGAYAGGEDETPTVWIEMKGRDFFLSDYISQSQEWRHYLEPMRSLSRAELDEVPAGTPARSCGLTTSTGWRFVKTKDGVKFLPPHYLGS